MEHRLHTFYVPLFYAAQIEVLIAEIPEDLQQKAKRRVCLAMDKYDIEKDIATDVKKHFDEECEGSWHCVVRNAFFTDDTKIVESRNNSKGTRQVFRCS